MTLRFRRDLLNNVNYTTETAGNCLLLEKLDGTSIPGRFSARRLRGFVPKEGTRLAKEQTEVEEDNQRNTGRKCQPEC